MTGKPIAVVVGGAMLFSLAACDLLSTHETDAPPAGVRESAIWWQGTTDILPPDLLAAYVAASDMHRRRGTSAVYVDLHAYHSMIGGPSYELRLPSPPPDGVLDRMRERLKSCDVTRRHGTLYGVKAEECKGCTPEEAEQVWRAAVEAATTPDEEKK